MKKLSSIILIFFVISTTFLYATGCGARSASSLPGTMATLRPRAFLDRVVPPQETYIPAERQRLLDAIEWQTEQPSAYLSAIVSVTRYCNAGCTVCVTDAPTLPADGVPEPGMQMTRERLEETISFLKKAAVKNLWIHGGGEPFLNDETIDMYVHLIESLESVSFVQITTNALWAMDADKMRGVLNKINNALRKRKNKKVEIIFAFSIDEFHPEVGVVGAANVIEAVAASQRKLFPDSTEECGVTFYSIATPKAADRFRQLKSELQKRIRGCTLEMSNLIEVLETGGSSYQNTGHVYLQTPPRGALRVIFLYEPGL